MQVKAKKSLGQHFLKDLGIARRIADTVSSKELDSVGATRWSTLPVVEIGPGMGVLTRFLVEAGHDVTAVELDSESVVYLDREMPQLRVVEADFLKLDLNELIKGSFILTGNYPYNISSQIFFKVLENREQIPVITGMLQKEVAERICALPGGKTRGILSVLLQTWYDCRYLFTVPPGVFSPPPKVNSGVLRLVRNSRTTLECDEKLYKRVIKTAFGQRRKTLRNSLSTMLKPDSPLRNDPIMSERPERLSVEQFISLTLSIEKEQ